MTRLICMLDDSKIGEGEHANSTKFFGNAGYGSVDRPYFKCTHPVHLYGKSYGAIHALGGAKLVLPL